MPQDDVVLHCSAKSTDGELERVLLEKRDFIEQSVKQPVIVSQSPPSADQMPAEIIRETTDVKGAQLHMIIVNRSPGGGGGKIEGGEKKEKKESKRR